MNMSLNTKLILSVIGIALLATPALAQESYRHASSRNQYNYQTNDPAGVYPNPIARSGSAAQVQSGAAFDTDRGY
ncbi:MAG: hypothetical protein WA268_09135 [Xanthobacteraceae bacterium]|jgi:hypothetical protein